MPAEQKVEQKEAVPDSDIEEKTTHLARKLVVLATSDDVTLDIENVLEEFGGEDECRDKVSIYISLYRTCNTFSHYLQLRLGEGGGSTRD